ncbi:hypothetical protein PI125_g5419 [Phytophthora idaei]|nr:hypothetical protein PI125_g5419 [Phytophthora idaei]
MRRVPAHFTIHCGTMSNEEINLPTIETSDNRVTVCAGQAISDDGACGRPCTLGGARLDDGEFLSSQTRVASIEHDPVAVGWGCRAEVPNGVHRQPGIPELKRKPGQSSS